MTAKGHATGSVAARGVVWLNAPGRAASQKNLLLFSVGFFFFQTWSLSTSWIAASSEPRNTAKIREEFAVANCRIVAILLKSCCYSDF